MLDYQKLYVELPKFKGRNVPITEIAKAKVRMPSIFVSDYSREFSNLVMLLSLRIHLNIIIIALTVRCGRKQAILTRRDNIG